MAVTILTKDNFKKEVLDSKSPILVDFWATWCGPCQMMLPIIEDFAKSNPDMKVGKVNVDEQPELAGEYGIMSIPTLIAFKNGEIYRTRLGVTPKDELKKMFN